MIALFAVAAVSLLVPAGIVGPLALNTWRQR